MDEAIHRLQQAPASDQLRASMARATRVVAQQAAVKEVKRQLQRVARLFTSLIARSWRWPRTTRSPRFSADLGHKNIQHTVRSSCRRGHLREWREWS
jgi:hypothetical protein